MGGSSASPPPPAAAVPAPGQVSRAPSDPPLLLFHAEEMESQVFQLECNGVQLCRREADNFVNGTKLLNLAHMTRGKRDAILKHERVRDVVKAGTMRLKGVWIPLARALVLAQLHRLETLAYPLLESDPWAYV
ncbi:transcription regulator HTH, apses-type DNA-binding domain-containing protein, partial [Blastocladiella britannica]